MPGCCCRLLREADETRLSNLADAATVADSQQGTHSTLHARRQSRSYFQAKEHLGHMTHYTALNDNDIVDLSDAIM
jgi:hypothetical protein